MASLIQISNEWYLATALYDAIDDENLRHRISILRIHNNSGVLTQFTGVSYLDRAITSLVQERNANPNVVIPDYSYTSLHLAVGHENEKFGQEVTKLLMMNGGNPNVT